MDSLRRIAEDRIAGRNSDHHLLLFFVVMIVDVSFLSLFAAFSNQHTPPHSRARSCPSPDAVYAPNIRIRGLDSFYIGILFFCFLLGFYIFIFCFGFKVLIFFLKHLPPLISLVLILFTPPSPRHGM